MARTKHDNPAEKVGADFSGATALEVAAPEALMRQAQADYAQERDLVNQVLGQAQMAGALEDLNRTVRISKIAFIKENKLYRAMGGMIFRTGAEKLSGTWEEFCGLLGKSVDQVDRDIANLKAFGEEALDNMSRMGIGYRDLRQYRRLGQDERTALIEAAKAGDKDELLDLAETLISKHTKEKEALVAERDALKADAAATDRVLAEKSKSITQLQKQIAGKTIDPQAEWSEAMRSLNAHVAAHRDGFVQSITALDVIREKVMQQEAEAGAEAALAAAREQIGRELGEAIERAEGIVAAVRRSFDLTLGALIG